MSEQSKRDSSAWNDCVKAEVRDGLYDRVRDAIRDAIPPSLGTRFAIETMRSILRQDGALCPDCAQRMITAIGRLQELANKHAKTPPVENV